MQEKSKHKLVVSALFCIILSLTTSALIARTSPSSPTLYVDPPSIEDPTILPNDTITIRLMIDSVADMETCEFNLTFNPTVLSVVNVTKLKIQDQYPQMNMDTDDVAGYIWISLTYKTALTILTDTALVEIEFIVKGYGQSPLHFDSSALYDGSGEPIPHETQDGFIWIFVRNILIQDVSKLVIETYVGRVIQINVTALNDGDIPESFTVSLFYDSTIIAAQDVTDLPSKENTTLTFNWDTSTASPRLDPYTIMANATILPNEIDELDNTFVDGTITLKLVGDVNGDGIVDIGDLNVWDAAFGSYPGHPDWNEQADLNADELVNTIDAQIILDHYHESL